LLNIIPEILKFAIRYFLKNYTIYKQNVSSEKNYNLQRKNRRDQKLLTYPHSYPHKIPKNPLFYVDLCVFSKNTHIFRKIVENFLNQRLYYILLETNITKIKKKEITYERKRSLEHSAR
jgi:hypothetical protein